MVSRPKQEDGLDIEDSAFHGLFLANLSQSKEIRFDVVNAKYRITSFGVINMLLVVSRHPKRTEHFLLFSK